MNDIADELLERAEEGYREWLEPFDGMDPSGESKTLTLGGEVAKRLLDLPSIGDAERTIAALPAPVVRALALALVDWLKELRDGGEALVEWLNADLDRADLVGHEWGVPTTEPADR